MDLISRNFSKHWFTRGFRQIPCRWLVRATCPHGLAPDPVCGTVRDARRSLVWMDLMAERRASHHRSPDRLLLKCVMQRQISGPSQISYHPFQVILPFGQVPSA
jgi:hypothetical protein